MQVGIVVSFVFECDFFPIHPEKKNGHQRGESQKNLDSHPQKDFFFQEKSGSWLKSMVFFGRFPPKMWCKKNSSTSHSHPGAGREGPLFGALPERRQPLRSAPRWIRVAKPRCGQTPVLLILVGGCVCFFPKPQKIGSKWWSTNFDVGFEFDWEVSVCWFSVEDSGPKNREEPKPLFWIRSLHGPQVKPMGNNIPLEGATHGMSFVWRCNSDPQWISPATRGLDGGFSTFLVCFCPESLHQKMGEMIQFEGHMFFAQVPRINNHQSGGGRFPWFFSRESLILSASIRVFILDFLFFS